MTQYNRDFPEEMGHSIAIVLRLSDSYMIISTNQSRHFTIVKFSGNSYSFVKFVV